MSGCNERVRGRAGRALRTLLVGLLVIAGDGEGMADPPKSSSSQRAYGSVESVVGELSKRIEEDSSLSLIRTIDYTRRAGLYGLKMPPTKLMFVANPVLNAQLIAAEPLMGLDLPYRVLVYQKPNGSIEILHQDPMYLERRYGYTGPLLKEYAEQLSQVTEGLAGVSLSTVFAGGVKLHDGIVILKSKRSVTEVVDRIKQGTIEDIGSHWFGELDYQRSAAAQGITIQPMKLALYGRPKLGARVMKNHVNLGLDYFGQRVLVWKGESGTQLAYDDINWHTRRRSLSNRHTIDRAREFMDAEMLKASQ